MSPPGMPQALRRLPIGVRPRPGETIGSYVIRLAHANHLRPDHLHAYLCGPPGWRGPVDLGRLAVCCGRPAAILQRTLTGPDTATRAKGTVHRKVDPNGAIRFDGAPYPVGRTFTGQTVQVTCQDETVQISRDGQPLRTWPVKVADPASLGRWGELALDQLQLNGDLAGTADRKVDSSGNISFADARYPVGRRFAGQTVQVGCVNGIVQLSHDGKPVRTWTRRHLPAKEPAMPGSLGRWGEVFVDQLAVGDADGTIEGTVDRKVSSCGNISYAGATYPFAHRFAGQMIQVRCVSGIVQLIHDGKLMRAWARRHPSAKEADIQADRSHDRGELALDQAARLAPLDDLASDPRVVRRTVDPNGAISFAGRYYAAGRALTGHVIQVRCVSGVVQLILDGEPVRAWRQRHTPEREQRMLQRPNPQQRTANARPLTSRRPTRPG